MLHLINGIFSKKASHWHNILIPYRQNNFYNKTLFLEYQIDPNYFARESLFILTSTQIHQSQLTNLLDMEVCLQLSL